MSEGRMPGLEAKVRAALRRHVSGVPANRQREIVAALAAFLEEELERVRRHCVALCRHRAELWQKTPLAGEQAPESARDEARARANEARYLADLIETEREVFPEADA
jgi:hypothetical protein